MNGRSWGFDVSEGLEPGNRCEFPGSGKSCNKSNTTGADAPGCSAACSFLIRYLVCTWRRTRVGTRRAMPPRRSAGCLARTRDSCLRRTGYLGNRGRRPQRVTASHPKALHGSVEQARRIPVASGWNRKVAEYAEVFNVMAEHGERPPASVLGSGWARL